jgi:hypothetical protein
MAITAAAAATAACSPSMPANPAPELQDLNSRLAATPDSTWARVRSRRVFFAHQSVGADIITGLMAWAARDPRLRLRIEHDSTAAALARPGLVHTTYGTNGDPQGKLMALQTLLAGGIGSVADVVIAKFCFLDLGDAGSGARLLPIYRQTMDTLHARYPHATLVYTTAALTAGEPAWRSGLKALTGRPTANARNAERAVFNAGVRLSYGHSGQLFDLAAREAGVSEATARRTSGEAVEQLLRAYTTDGGHLTPAASQIMAGHLLLLLASLANRPAPP